MNKTLIFTSIFLLISTLSFGQTQEEIEQMLDGNNTETTEKVKKEKKTKEEKTEKTKGKADKIVKEKKSSTSTAALPTFDVEADLLNMKYKKLKKGGDTHFSKGNYFSAINHYQAATTKTKKKKKLLYTNMQLGESFYGIRDYESAQEYFAVVGQDDKKNKYPTSEYQLANTFKYQAKYDTAITIYREFLAQAEKEKDVDFEKGRARLEIKGCKFADTLMVDFEEYVVENAGENINSPFAEFGPGILNDQELVYSKISADRAMAEANGMTEDHYSKLFAEGGSFSDALNEGEMHIGNPSFTKDGNTIYFTKCKVSEEGKNMCDIYTSNQSNGKWASPVKVDAVNAAEVSTTQPFITKDNEGNNVLYFVSERERGRGGKDIWYATMNEDGSFNKAKNMGYPINTRYDDISPYYHQESQTLYFSSNGHVSLGGFDIFKAVQDEDGDFEDPKNLKTPINSSLDDYDFILTADTKEGYIVSNRTGTTTTRSVNCCDDIWNVNKAIINVTVSGKVYAENEGKKTLIDSALVKIIDTDLTEILDEVTFNGEEPFSFVVESDKNYKLIAEHALFDPVELDFNTNGITRPESVTHDLALSVRNIQDMVVGVIYYEYNQAKLREDAPDTLQRVITFMESYPKATLEVGAHTDSKGKDTYNEELSKKRAESAFNFLVNEGKIDTGRIEINWYGETMPIEPNENEDGSDNPEGRAKNRRTEFKVIGTKIE